MPKYYRILYKNVMKYIGLFAYENGVRKFVTDTFTYDDAMEFIKTHEGDFELEEICYAD